MAVYAQATVHPLIPIKGKRRWLVRVRGRPPHNVKRRYTIEADEEGEAAMAGIQRFCDEIEAKELRAPNRMN